MGKKRTGVKPASKSSIEISFIYQGERCRERIKLPPTPANIKYCENLRGAILKEIAHQTFDYCRYFPESTRALTLGKTPGSIITVNAQLDRYLKQAQKSLQKSTWLDYKKSALSFWGPQIGKHSLDDLDLPTIKDCLDIPLSKKRIYNILIPLRNALILAVEDGLMTANPIANWYPKIKETAKDDDIDPFDMAEIGAILHHCDGQIKNLFQFAFWSGLRTSELIALEWRDIDWLHGTVMIRRAYVRGEVKPPKTAAGKRDLTLLEPALEALKRQKIITKGYDHVFLNPRTMAPWAGDGAIRKTAWIPALKAAQVRYRYPYQTRHTYASIMLSAGENPLWVAGQMGHADVTMIFKKYGRWIPSINPDAGKKAVSIWTTSRQRKHITN